MPEVVEEDALLAAERHRMSSLCPLQRGGVTDQGVGKVSIHAALIKKRGHTGIDVDSGHAGKPVGCQDRRQADRVQRWIVVTDAGGMDTVHAEAVGPKSGWSDGPVVLRAAVLGSRDVNNAIAVVAENSGLGEYVVMTTVTPTDLVVRRDLMIQFDVKLPGWIGGQNDLTEVGLRIDCARYVGVRIKIQNRLADGVDLVGGDYVAGELCSWARRGRSLVSSARVVDAVVVRGALGEIARTLVVGGNDPFQSVGIPLANLLEIDKEECLVLLQRTAEREAVLIPHVVGLFAGVKVVAGIKCRPLPVPPPAAVEGVRALLQDHVHDGAAVVAELGGKAVVLDLEFLHDLDRRLVVDVGVSALALFRRAQGTAIKGNLGRGVALAVGDEVRAGGIVIVDPGARGFRHPACQKHQPKHAAAVKRNVSHVLIADVRAERSTLRVQ